jgi:hypothetical protein
MLTAIPDERRCISMSNEEKYDDSFVLAKGTDTLNDGRMFKYEAWSDCGYTFLTYTLSFQGFESFTKEMIIEYLRAQGINLDLEKYSFEDIDFMMDENSVKITITCGVSDY